jgi:hypothetical protein
LVILEIGPRWQAGDNYEDIWPVGLAEYSTISMEGVNKLCICFKTLSISNVD